MGVVNHSVEQNTEGDAAYQRALKLGQEILPQVRKPVSVSRLICTVVLGRLKVIESTGRFSVDDIYNV